MDDIHSRIKRLRIEKQLSMEGLAALVGVKSWQTIQQWEKPNGTAPKRERLQRVADALGTSQLYLLMGEAPAPLPLIAREAPAKYNKPHHDRHLLQCVCSIAIQIDDTGLRNLIDIAECLARNHPFVKPKLA